MTMRLGFHFTSFTHFWFMSAGYVTVTNIILHMLLMCYHGGCQLSFLCGQCISCRLYIFATNSYVRGKIHCNHYLGPGRVMRLGYQHVFK